MRHAHASPCLTDDPWNSKPIAPAIKILPAEKCQTNGGLKMGEVVDPANAVEWKFHKAGGRFIVSGSEWAKSVSVSIGTKAEGAKAPELMLVAPHLETRGERGFGSRRVCNARAGYAVNPDGFRDTDPEIWRSAWSYVVVKDPDDIEQLGRMLRVLGRELVVLGRDRKRRAKGAKASPEG